MVDRHLGIKAIEGENGRAAYNLVLRARHIGISGHLDLIGNEVYIDSYATNAFALGPRRNATLNKIFGTGYHVLGVGWANNLSFTRNFIHLVAHKQFDRSDEYGIHCSVNGIRSTQYSGGTTRLENMLYEGNVVSVSAIAACSQARGIQLASDAYFTNVVVRDNIFRATLLDPGATKISVELAAVVAHGLPDRIDTTNPILYYDNTLMSNYRLFNFADSYSSGSKHYFIRSRLVREGSVDRFKPIGVGYYRYDTLDNRILSSTLQGDINLEDAYFQSSGRQEYSVGAAAHIRALDCGGRPLLSKSFTVRDSRGTVLQGTTDPTTGEAIIQVLHYTMVGSPSSRQGVKVLHENPELKLDGYTALALSPQLMESGASPQSPAQVRFVQTGESCPAGDAPSAPKNLRMRR
jgi:hypothetical protein